MSLDTVLEIGRAFRKSKEGLNHFRYIKSCPEDSDKGTVLRLSIPITEDFLFDLDRTIIVPENEEDKLNYLTFKTSDSDGYVKYIFGDIYYEQSSTLSRDGSIKTNEKGYYRLANDASRGMYKLSSFDRGKGDYLDIIESYKKTLLKNSNEEEVNKKVEDLVSVKFRKSFEKNSEFIENILRNIAGVKEFFGRGNTISFSDFLESEDILKEYSIKNNLENLSSRTINKLLGSKFDPNNLSEKQKQKLLKYSEGQIFLHFNFNEKHWYEFEEDLELIINKMLEDFFDSSSNDSGLVLKKTLYKTLCSGDKKNDIQFPNFQLDAKHKSRAFTDKEAQDLFYSIDYSKKGIINVLNTDIKIIVLPRGENLTAKDYQQFLEKRNELALRKNNENHTSPDDDPLFVPLELEREENITSFDMIFSKKGGLSSPDVDLLEISGIEKSSLRATKQRISQIAQKIVQKRKLALKTDKKLKPITIEYSLINILGSCQKNNKTGKVQFKANPKYQSHILKVLPQIYSQNYYQDEVLLPALIENVEFSIRSGDPKFNFLKFDFEFLSSIQNTKTNNSMEIINSESYQIGLLLGSLAKNVASEIKSFEKNYVGNLTRRIGRIEDFVKLKNDIEQKLIMHEKAKYTHQISYELAQKLKNFEDKYDKEACAFGFFESYFKRETKKGFVERLEKLIASNVDDEENKKLIEQINLILTDHKIED